MTLRNLHDASGAIGRSVRAWVATALNLEPDLILLGGDLVDHFAPDDVTPLLEQLSRLRAPLGVFSVRGNHDYRRFGDEVTDIEDDLAAIGIVTFANRGVVVRDDLDLAGVDDSNRGHARIDEALAARPVSLACLLMSHDPDVLPRVPPRST